MTTRKVKRAGALFRAAQRGITLIELVVTVAVVGALAALGTPMYSDYRDKANNTKAAADIVSLQFDIKLYASVHNDQLPNSLDDLGRGVIRDPWGNPYRYLNIATAHGHGQVRKDRFLVPLNSDYDLYSMGKDGQSQSPLTARASRDDIIRAGNGAYIGPASEF